MAVQVCFGLSGNDDSELAIAFAFLRRIGADRAMPSDSPRQAALPEAYRECLADRRPLRAGRGAREAAQRGRRARPIVGDDLQQLA